MTIEIVPGVYRLSGIWDNIDLGANVYLIADDTLTLVDTGFKGKAKEIMERIVRLGYSFSDIANIILTHHHPDHTGNLAALKEITQARVIAHRADAVYIDGSLPQPGPSGPQWLRNMSGHLGWLLNTAPAEVDIQVDDGDELPVSGGIKILHTPGHTPGSICIFLKQKGVVLVGDLLAQRFGLRLPSIPFTADTARAIKSVKKLAKEEFDVICFGHGLPLKHGARNRVVEFASRLNRNVKSER